MAGGGLEGQGGEERGRQRCCEGSALVEDEAPSRMDTMVHRITESQNSRGWKGPLWVI